MDSVEQRCIELIAGAKNIALDTVHPQSTFDQLDMDSLDKINLSFAVEESFGIEIPDAEIYTIRTVSDMVEGIRRLIALKQPTP